MPESACRDIPDFSRLGLRAYSCSRRVELTRNGAAFAATLIAISNYGARLRAPDGQSGLALGDRVCFDLGIPGKGLAPGRIPCRVSWLEDGEVEVAFASLLGTTMGEMQAAVDG